MRLRLNMPEQFDLILELNPALCTLHCLGSMKGRMHHVSLDFGLGLEDCIALVAFEDHGLSTCILWLTSTKRGSSGCDIG